MVAIDVKSDIVGRQKIYNHVSKKTIKTDIIEYAQQLEQAGAGELFVNSVDRDGTMRGYDINLIKSITSQAKIPVIACGGAGQIGHFREVIEAGGAAAVAAGSMFVFQGRHRAVLINYPSPEQIRELSMNIKTKMQVDK